MHDDHNQSGGDRRRTRFDDEMRARAEAAREILESINRVLGPDAARACSATMTVARNVAAIVPLARLLQAAESVRAREAINEHISTVIDDTMQAVATCAIYGVPEAQRTEVASMIGKLVARGYKDAMELEAFISRNTNRG